MNGNPALRAAGWMVLLLLAACGGSSSDGGSRTRRNPDPPEPAFSAQRFGPESATIAHAYLPLVPGTTWTYTAETEDGIETTVVEVLDETRTVAGVECRVVWDRVFLDGVLVEDTWDWFAQDDEGNIWYLGEAVDNYEYDDDGNLLEVTHEGAWEAGEDGAQAGILIKGDPAVGDSYRQEYYEGVAEDMAKVVALDVTVELENGVEYEGCVQTLEWNPLEEDSEEYKYYAPGVGLVKEEEVSGEEVVELRGVFATGEDRVPDFAGATFTKPATIDHPYLPMEPGTTWTYTAETEDGIETTVVEVLDETRTVAGVECRVVRDRVYLGDGLPLDENDLLMEDTRDWLAQDDEGNVWYLGEAVDNYEYDDDGNLLEVTHEGAWEAGRDGARPGIVMWASPEPGRSYYQEYAEGEAEDMGYVVATDVTVQLDDGPGYTNCIQILDWNPLEPAVLEYKYYAPGVGVVREEVIAGEDEATVELKAMTSP